MTVRPDTVILLETVISMLSSVEPLITRPAEFAVPKVPLKFTSLVTTETLPLTISN